MAFSFTGVESFVVTAFEASTSKAIRFPSQTIAYFILVIYILVTIGEVLLVRASDPRLPLNAGDGTRDKSAAPYPHSSAYAILGVWDWGSSNLAGFLNACLIFSVLSASNSLLYMASRTLYGMTRELPTTNAFGRAFRKLSYVVPRTGVPAAALCVSAISFIWLPFLQLQGGYAIQKVRADTGYVVPKLKHHIAHSNHVRICQRKRAHRLGIIQCSIYSLPSMVSLTQL